MTAVGSIWWRKHTSNSSCARGKVSPLPSGAFCFLFFPAHYVIIGIDKLLMRFELVSDQSKGWNLGEGCRRKQNTFQDNFGASDWIVDYSRIKVRKMGEALPKVESGTLE